MNLKKTQSKLLKSALGISKFCRNTPLLDAMKLHSVCKLRDIYQLDLFKSMLVNGSKAKTFYYHLMSLDSFNKLDGHCDLYSHVKNICLSNNISLTKYIICDKYSSHCRSHLKSGFSREDGFIDSIRQQLYYHNISLLNNLLIPF